MASESGSKTESSDGKAAAAAADPGVALPDANQAAAPSRPEVSQARSEPSWLQRVHAWFEQHYGLDLRSIAVLRIALGYLLLSDLAMRALDLGAHYTDAGILTRERLVGGWGQPLFYSLHTYGGDTISQAVLFAVAAVFAFMLLVGYRTRLAAIVSWVLLCSLQGRNYIVLQGGDDILRVMLFWSIFVPLSARFSVDAVLAERRFLAQPASAGGTLAPITATTRRKLPKHVLSVATTVLVMQLLTMYFVSAALKTGPTWQRDGSAVHLALHHHAFASVTGQLVRQLPSHVLQGMTWQVWWLELLGPLLFFVPWGTFWWRTVQAALFISFHFGLFMTMELGPFPWVTMFCWLVVLPSWFWDKPLCSLTLLGNFRQKLRAASITLQAMILRNQTWLREPFKLPRVRPTLVATLVVLGIASYAAYGSAYAMTHGGNVHGERFHPLLIARLYANWGMFAPNPPNTSGWFVTVAKQKNGNEIDVWNGGQPVTFEMPRLPSATFKRERWRKFGDNILSSNHAPIRGYFLRWMCNDWNEDHSDSEDIEKITLYHMAQTANWPGKGYGPLSKNELARETCPPPPDEAKAGTEQQSKPETPANRARPRARKATPEPLPKRSRPGIEKSTARPAATSSASILPKSSSGPSTTANPGRPSSL